MQNVDDKISETQKANKIVHPHLKKIIALVSLLILNKFLQISVKMFITEKSINFVKYIFWWISAVWFLRCSNKLISLSTFAQPMTWLYI